MGLGSGGKTPQSVIDAVGYVDVPFATSSAATAAECLRMPRPWTATYTSDFNRALDQLVSYVQAQGVGPITILKGGRCFGRFARGRHAGAGAAGVGAGRSGGWRAGGGACLFGGGDAGAGLAQRL